MYEAYEILGFVLFGLLGVYLAVFYGSLVVSWVYGSYLHDGDKKVWSLHRDLIKMWQAIAAHDFKLSENDEFFNYFFFGFLLPAFYLMLSLAFIGLTKSTGMLIPYCLIGVALAWGILYTLRGVIRLNKKLDKHASDKNAHGEQ